MTHCTSALPLALALGLWPIVAAAQGGPPLMTDDPGTPGPARWEINLATLVETSTYRRLVETPRVDLNYGVGARVQLKFEVPVVGLRKQDAATTFGAGNATVGVKWRWMESAASRVACSIYPQLEFNTSRASITKGIVDEGMSFFMPAEVTLTLPRVALNAEAGRDFAGNAGDAWIYGLAAALAGLEWADLIAELHGEHVRGEPGEIFANVGVRRAVNSRVTLLVAVGQAVRGPIEERRHRYLYTGVQLNLPAERGLTSAPSLRARPR